MAVGDTRRATATGGGNGHTQRTDDVKDERQTELADMLTHIDEAVSSMRDELRRQHAQHSLVVRDLRNEIAALTRRRQDVASELAAYGKAVARERARTEEAFIANVMARVDLGMTTKEIARVLRRTEAHVTAAIAAFRRSRGIEKKSRQRGVLRRERRMLK
jgi:hypothetical protein